MRRYETIVILKPSLGEAENQTIIDRTTGTIAEFGGSIVKIDKWGLRKTAYPINKETQGYYVYLQYAGMPAGVDEMERVFRIDDSVLKFLTVKLQDVFAALPEDEDAMAPNVPAEKEEEMTEAPAGEELAANTEE
jgi:small subunit ribosomal protein S6